MLTDTTPNQRAILVLLASRPRHDWKVHVLAKRLGLSQKSVARSIASLAARGLLVSLPDHTYRTREPK